MATYSLTAVAKRDLDDITFYIHLDNPTAAEKFARGFATKCLALAQYPYLGVARDDLQQHVRVLPYGNYLIFYEPIADGVQIRRLLHGAQDYRRLFKTR